MQDGEHFLQTLNVTQQATAAGDPANVALDDPALGQDHLGRKSDSEPGVKTIWQGLQRVMTAAETLATYIFKSKFGA